MHVLEDVKKVVSQYFRVYDVRWDRETVAFYCTPDMERLEENFESLRIELKHQGYVPMIVSEGGEHIIYVTQKPHMKFRSVIVNLIFFFLTILTTVIAGTLEWSAYIDPSIEDVTISEIFRATNVLYGGLFFALPLIVILGTHELGHYYMARRHNVSASLPFFIPAPPPLGTLGAFITMREPIPNKKALLDIGISGPIAGFIMAFPVTILGLYLTAIYAIPMPLETKGVVLLGTPLVFQWLAFIIPTAENVLLHPTAMAGWVGFLVTSINLLPAGQLDGGHIARALLGDKAKYASYASVIFMISISMIFKYYGWLLLIVLILIIGLFHPPPLNDITSIGNKRKLLGIFSAGMLVVTFIPVPIETLPPEYGLNIYMEEGDIYIPPNATASVSFYINNTGNSEDTYLFKIYNTTGPGSINISKEKVKIKAGGWRELFITITTHENATLGENISGVVEAISKNDKRKKGSIVVNASVGYMGIYINETSFSAYPGEFVPITVNYSNRAMEEIYIYYNVSLKSSNESLYWSYLMDYPNMRLQPGENKNLTIIIKSPQNALAGENLTFQLMTMSPSDNNYTLTINFSISILPVHSLFLEVQKNLTISPGNYTLSHMLIRNTGNIEDRISIDIEEITGIMLTHSSLPDIIEPGELINVTLNINADKNVSRGIYYITVKVRSIDNVAMITTGKIELRID